MNPREEEQPRRDELPSTDEQADDEMFDLESEDIVDLEPSEDSSHASAVEGVEMLDFLEDDEGDAPTASPPPARPAPEPTIDLSAGEADGSEDTVDAEIDNIDDLEVVDVAAPADEAGDAGPEITMAEKQPTAASRDQNDNAAGEEEDDLADFFGDLETAESAMDQSQGDPDSSEPTVNDKREPTAVTQPGDVPPEAEAEAGKGADEFDLREEPEEDVAADVSPESQGGLDAAVAPASLADRSKKKKSSLPAIVIASLLLLLIAGGVGGLYLAGLLPGGIATEGNTAADNPNGGGRSQSPDDAVAARNALVERINNAEQELRDLYRAANDGEDIDGAKIDEAKQLLAQLKAEDEQVYAEEPIQQHKRRFDELAKDFARQAKRKAEEQRAAKFMQAYDLARADSPRSLDDGMLAEARKYANKDELKLLEALEREVARYQLQQAAELEAKKQNAFAGIAQAAAAADPVLYRQSIEAYLAAYPDGARADDLAAVLKSDAPALAALSRWNALLDDWSQSVAEPISAERAAAMVKVAQQRLEQGGELLPGAAEVDRQLMRLRPIAKRQEDAETLLTSLRSIFTSPATKASFVFATQDGQRYYTAQKPTKQGDKYLVQRFTDLEGSTEPIELSPADADRSVTGAANAAATANAVRDELEQMDLTDVEARLLNALKVVVDDEKLDPVIKTAWLVALSTTGSKLSLPLEQATAAYRDLASAGVDAKFNWADVEAAAAVRPTCADALAALPEHEEIQQQALAALAESQAFSVPTRLTPVGVLRREMPSDENASAAWGGTLIAEAGPSTQVDLFFVEDDEELARLPVGTINDGTLAIGDEVAQERLREGRILYAEVAAKRKTAQGENENP